MNQEHATSQVQPSRKQGIPLVLLLAVFLLAGLGARVRLTQLAVRWAYVPDHFDNIGMGLTAERFGLFKVYAIGPDFNAEILGQAYSEEQGKFVQYPRRPFPFRVANYPPLGVALFWASSGLFALIDPSFYINTFTSRLVMSVPSVLAELALAVGVFLLGRQVRGARAGLVAACVCWLLPPLAMDSSFWGQTDSWFLAPAVFFVWLMLRRRWVLAGLCGALAVLLKPQGILLAPVALFAAALVPEEPKLTPRVMAVRLGRMVSAGLGAVLLVTLPWTIADGTNWIDKAYVANFTMYAETTLKAFNVWYADALRIDSAGGLEGTDSKATLLGTAKTSWGRLFVLTAMVVLAVMTWRRFRDRPALAVTLFAGLWLWSTFIWPTGVHERYIVYGMPLVVLSATVMKRLWPAVAALAIVGAMEMCHNVWLKCPVDMYPKVARGITARAQELYSLPPERRPPPDQINAWVEAELAKARRSVRGLRQESESWEYLATVLSLASYGWAAVSVFWTRRTRPPAPTEPHKDSRRHKHRGRR